MSPVKPFVRVRVMREGNPSGGFRGGQKMLVENLGEGGGTKDPLRCTCGSLLARLVPGGVEIKCRRCKRLIVVTLEEDGLSQERDLTCKEV